ncbi:MAG: 30S ribosomal protein S4e [Candidatus Hydrothermarchaeaceae archaeon]
MKKHMKRLAAPRTWQIKRKEAKWTAKPKPGPHKVGASIPLMLAVRDYLKYAGSSGEAKKIIREGNVVVDKKVRKDFKFPLGLMDIVEIPKTRERYLVLFDKMGKLILKKISKASSKYKLCKIVNKTVVRGGNIQLNLHDGRNFLLSVKKDIYKTKDTLLLDVEKNSIKKHLHFKAGNLALITGGRHRAEVARIKEINTTRTPEPNTVTLSNNSRTFSSVEDYVFVIGEKKPEISEVSK